MTPIAYSLGVLLAAALAAAPSRAASDPAGQAAAALERTARELQVVEGRLAALSNQLGSQREVDRREALLRRFHDAEIQYLLTDYRTASVLLYDLVGQEAFQALPEYGEALYLLAESLYQQNNLLGARLYFRAHLDLPGRHLNEALARYLDICTQVDDFSGVDRYVDRLRAQGRELPPEVGYALGKWLRKRPDLPPAVRRARARDVLAAVVEGQGALAARASYLLGVLAVEDGDLEAADEHFAETASLARSLEQNAVLDQALLARGRIAFEQGRVSDAIGHYQEIDYRSDAFIDALFETAWAYVKRAAKTGAADYENAQQACEKLLMAAPDSPLAPEARMLQGHLLLKLGKFAEASEAYTQVLQELTTVHDRISEQLASQKDLVRTFQKLVGETESGLDLGTLLPPVAAKWVGARREVADAIRVAGDLEASRKGLEESAEVSERLEGLLQRPEGDFLPEYRDALASAEAAQSALASLEADLLRVERTLLGDERVQSLTRELEALRAERAQLEARVRALPRNDQELQARRARAVEQVRDLDRAAYRLGYQVESLFAVLTGVEHFAAAARAREVPDAEEERERARRVEEERAHARTLRAELQRLQRQIRDERARLELVSSADAELRAQYQAVLERERALLAGARAQLPAETRALLAALDRQRDQIGVLRGRAEAIQGQVRDRVRRKSEGLRAQVAAERELLQRYEQEVAAAREQARDLVGQVAYQSVRRVRDQFHDLVLKADVGLVDVAWTRKQEKTQRIQALAQQKDRELKGLDAEFAEALEDVD